MPHDCHIHALTANGRLWTAHDPVRRFTRNCWRVCDSISAFVVHVRVEWPRNLDRYREFLRAGSMQLWRAIPESRRLRSYCKCKTCAPPATFLSWPRSMQQHLSIHAVCHHLVVVSPAANLPPPQIMGSHLLFHPDSATAMKAVGVCHIRLCPFHKLFRCHRCAHHSPLMHPSP